MRGPLGRLRALLFALLPGAGQPLAQAPDGVVGQAREQGRQVRLDVDARLPRVLDEREEVGDPRAPSASQPTRPNPPSIRAAPIR